jgi:hypothetical protein
VPRCLEPCTSHLGVKSFTADTAVEVLYGGNMVPKFNCVE